MLKDHGSVLHLLHYHYDLIQQLSFITHHERVAAGGILRVCISLVRQHLLRFWTGPIDIVIGLRRRCW